MSIEVFPHYNLPSPVPQSLTFRESLWHWAEEILVFFQPSKVTWWHCWDWRSIYTESLSLQWICSGPIWHLISHDSTFKYNTLIYCYIGFYFKKPWNIFKVWLQTNERNPQWFIYLIFLALRPNENEYRSVNVDIVARWPDTDTDAKRGGRKQECQRNQGTACAVRSPPPPPQFYSLFRLVCLNHRTCLCLSVPFSAKCQTFVLVNIWKALSSLFPYFKMAFTPANVVRTPCAIFSVS